jgi:hypothetical protein
LDARKRSLSLFLFNLDFKSQETGTNNPFD